jgi:hypothetical protein
MTAFTRASFFSFETAVRPNLFAPSTSSRKVSLLSDSRVTEPKIAVAVSAVLDVEKATTTEPAAVGETVSGRAEPSASASTTERCDLEGSATLEGSAEPEGSAPRASPVASLTGMGPPTLSILSPLVRKFFVSNV